MVPDHPTIKNCENTGYPDGREAKEPICPRCGRECDTIYYDVRYGDIVGCENCISAEDAWEEPLCF